MTIKEIADLAGTSRGTVDRVLHGRGKVSPELEARILEIAASRNYQPNQIARALVNSKKRVRLGVVINSVGNPFFEDVLLGINRCAEKLAVYGVEVSVREIRGYDAAEQLSAIAALLEQGVDGLAVMPIDVPEVREQLSALTVPLVTINTDVDVERLAFVGCDYYNSGMISGDLARLMLSGGGSVAVIMGSFLVRGHKERLRGFEDCLADCPSISVSARLENQDDDDISYGVVSQLLRQQAPDLIYFGAAGLEGGMRAVDELAPDIRVIAVDDTPLVRRYLESGAIAATVTQQPYVQGEQCIRILYEFIAEKKSPEYVCCYTKNHVKVKHSRRQPTPCYGGSPCCGAEQ